MKKLILIAILTVATAGAINLTYPSDLVKDYMDASENMVREYERACMDSVEVMGIWIATPAAVRTALLQKVAAHRLEVIAAWIALNDYIMGD